jgi:hypothetical protein
MVLLHTSAAGHGSQQERLLRPLLPPVRPAGGGPHPTGTIVTITVTTIVDSLESALDLDFASACTELADARFQQSCKDTPVNRTAVAEARSRMDAVLDMYLDAVARRG